MLISCFSWLWFVLPYTEKKEHPYQCSRILCDRERPKGFGQPNERRNRTTLPDRPVLPSVLWLLHAWLSTWCYTKPGWANITNMPSCIIVLKGTQTGPGTDPHHPFMSPLKMGCPASYTVPRRLHSSTSHWTGVFLRPSLPLKLCFVSHRHYNPGKTGTNLLWSMLMEFVLAIKWAIPAQNNA